MSHSWLCAFIWTNNNIKQVFHFLHIRTSVLSFVPLSPRDSNASSWSTSCVWKIESSCFTDCRQEVMLTETGNTDHHCVLYQNILQQRINTSTSVTGNGRQQVRWRTRADRMGRKMVMVAALLATSVTVVTMMQATVMVAKTGRPPRGSRSSATQRERPDTCTRTRRDTQRPTHTHLDDVLIMLRSHISLPSSLCGNYEVSN